MKNGSSKYSSKRTTFWRNTYRQFIKTITFSNDVSNVPSGCTEDNLCFDLTDTTSDITVYGYLTDSGEVNSNSKTLYDLNIVSKNKIYAPTNCFLFFAGFNELESINFNNNFDTSNVTNMDYMFVPIDSDWSTVASNMSSYNDIKSTILKNNNSSDNGYIEPMATEPEPLDYWSNLTSIDLSGFNTSNVVTMKYMFYESRFVNLDLSNFNTSKVTNMYHMFYRCFDLITTINIMNNNVTNYESMFYSAATTKDSQITVNYIPEASELVDNMIATKSTSSNIVKGIEI